MKKVAVFSVLFSLMIIFSACSSSDETADDIYEKIHSGFYDVDSYVATCNVKTINPGGETNSTIEISYDKLNDVRRIISDGMTLEISKNQTVVSKGGASVKTESRETDMLFFPENFFKSYYMSENTSLSVMAEGQTDTLILECEAAGFGEGTSHLKMWMNKKTIKPEKLQAYDGDGNMHTEITYVNFNFK